MEEFNQVISKFYQVECQVPVQLYLHVGKEWEDCFIALDFMEHIFILRSESNEFKGERKNREDIVSLLYNNILGQLKAREIQKKEVGARLLEFIEKNSCYEK